MWYQLVIVQHDPQAGPIELSQPIWLVIADGLTASYVIFCPL